MTLLDHLREWPYETFELSDIPVEFHADLEAAGLLEGRRTSFDVLEVRTALKRRPKQRPTGIRLPGFSIVQEEADWKRTEDDAPMRGFVFRDGMIREE